MCVSHQGRLLATNLITQGSERLPTVKNIRRSHPGRLLVINVDRTADCTPCQGVVKPFFFAMLLGVSPLKSRCSELHPKAISNS